MANHRKVRERFQAEMLRLGALRAAKTPAQQAAEDAAFEDSVREVSDAEEAAEVLAVDPTNPLFQAMARSIEAGGLPGCNRCFIWQAEAAQKRARKLRRRYGPGWIGSMRLYLLRSDTARDAKRSAWAAVRWLEKEGFVATGPGWIRWVGALG